MSQIAEVGNMITFDCDAVAWPYPSYSWSTPNPATNQMSSIITFAATFTSFGNYTCTASSNITMAVSDTAVLTGNFVLYYIQYV